MNSEGTAPAGFGDGTAPFRPTAAVLEVGTVIGGRYRVQERAGSGASSVVYRAQDEATGMEVALKVYDPAFLTEENLKRIGKEVATSWRNSHPNVIRIHDWGREGAGAFLVMEHCPGGTLRSKMRPGEGMPSEEACAVARQILLALSELHRPPTGSGGKGKNRSWGTVHRDVKPDNCFFGADGILKLGDFGIVKEFGHATLTQDGAALGTVRYMAPEVIQGTGTTPRSDLYSVGVVLYELLGGVHPFEGSSAPEVLSGHLQEKPDLKRLKRRGVPRYLRRITERLLEKYPADRYPNAGAVLEALDRHRAGFALPRRIWSKGAALGGFFLLIAAAFVADRLLSRLLPLKPAFEGKTLAVSDYLGRVLWRKELPREIQSVHYGHFGPGGSGAVACAVKWGPMAAGSKEVLSGLSPALERMRNAIVLFNRNGSSSGRFTVDLPFQTFSPRYKVDLSSNSFARGEPEKLVAEVSHELWYPTALILFGTAEPFRGGGPVRQVFCNSGRFDTWICKDVDGDGAEDIICTGVNNLLYWSKFAAIVIARDDSSLVQSPDLNLRSAQAPLFYRSLPFSSLNESVDLSPLPRPALAQFTLSGGGHAFLAPDGSLMRDGVPLPPDPAQVYNLNRTISAMYAAKEQGDFHEVLGLCEKWPSGLAEPYEWLGRFFRAEALKGLGRYAEIPAVLDETRPNSEMVGFPEHYYQFLVDAAFLAGDFDRCLKLTQTFPSNEWGGRPEVLQTVVWAAIYSGEADIESRYLSNPSSTVYDDFRGLIPGVQALFRGDFSSAVTNLRAAAPTDSYYPSPGLWLIECLIREGKLHEAREIMGSLEASFITSELGSGETGLWLEWREGRQDAAILEEMDRVVESKRRKARTDVEARALLPLTLARCARMHRDLGEAKRADALMDEALSLAPKNWRKVLSQT